MRGRTVFYEFAESYASGLLATRIDGAAENAV